MLVLIIYKVAFYTEKWMSAASNFCLDTRVILDSCEGWRAGKCLVYLDSISFLFHVQ